nr:arylesterase [Roseovarius faecimaris]
MWGKALVLFWFLSIPAWGEEITVLAFGDSLTQGYGLPAEDGLVPQLEGWLRGQGAEVRLINGGVSGDTTAGGAARIDWSLTPDIDAMILTLGGNDLLRGIDPAVTRANLERILDSTAERDVPVLLVGMQASGNYGAEFKSAFDAIYPDLAADYGVALYPSFFAGLGDGTPQSFLPYFQGDGIHPNAEGVRLIVAALGPAVLELVDSAQ